MNHRCICWWRPLTPRKADYVMQTLTTTTCTRTQCYSTDSKNGNSTNRRGSTPRNDLPDGFAAFRQTLTRVRERAHLFQRYKQANVFAASPPFSSMAAWFQFFQLNRPQETQVDMVEFLEGAKFAIESTMLAMYSREFVDSVMNKRSNGVVHDRETVIYEPTAIERLEQTLDPVALKAFKLFIRHTEQRGLYSELIKLEIGDVELLGVDYQRIPAHSVINSTGAIITGVPMYERLTLDVVADTIEHIKLHTIGDTKSSTRVRSEREEDDVVIKENQTVWQFTSNVTSPDDLDWIITPCLFTVDEP